LLLNVGAAAIVKKYSVLNSSNLQNKSVFFTLAKKASSAALQAILLLQNSLTHVPTPQKR
jgi:hypothetical protein